jgi:signal transduction histidine kinase
MISAELDLEKLVQAVNDAATSLCRAKFGAFFYKQTKPDGEALTLYTISGVPREQFSSFPMPRKTGIFGPTFDGKGVVRSDDITQDPRYGKMAPNYGMPAGHLPVRSYLAVPVVARNGEVIGGLFLGHPEAGKFGEREERTVVGLAAQAAVAVDNARLYQNAKDAIAARDDFLSICSHELRTPLTSLKLQTQLSQRVLEKNKIVDPAMDRFKKFLENANGQIDRLVRLVEDMLDIARIRAGKLSLSPERMDLAIMVQEVLERFGPQITANGVKVSLRLDQGVLGTWDRFRLEQVFVNLLTNALKYGAGSAVEITAVNEGGAARLSVRDHGIGIDKANQQRIFERFERAVSKQNISGLGLGLFIVRQIVEAHGGTISVESEPGTGSCFTVDLPLQHLRETPRPKEPFAHA